MQTSDMGALASEPPRAGPDADLGLSLADLLSLVDPHLVVADAFTDHQVSVRGVSIYDPAEAIEPETMVLAVGFEIGTDDARRLVRAAARGGAAGVVFRTASPAVWLGNDGIAVLRVRPELSWTQVVDLLQALVGLKTVGVGRTPFVANTMDGLADAVAAMVGGPVVVYDQAHQVIGYALLGHEIDEVRRESICGQRTPEQWVTRFTEDNSAYQTFRCPGTVVRVDGYADLRTRLRVAVHLSGEILGELSVSEGKYPLDERAEDALATAARLAAPLMLRYKRAAEGDRVRQSQILLGILHDSDTAVRHAAELGLRVQDRCLLVGFDLAAAGGTDGRTRDILNERGARLLSMQLNFSDAPPLLVSDRQVFYALLPAPSDSVHGILASRLRATLAQLAQIGMQGRAAVGPVSTDLRGVSAARVEVDRLLEVGRRNGMNLSVLTVEDSWAELSMLSIDKVLHDKLEDTCPPLAKLVQHDQEHGSELVSTLSTFIDEFGSVSEASKRLYIHQNTLRHRLQRIAKVSGMDLENPVERLVVSCYLRKLVGHGGGSERPSSHSRFTTV